MPSENVLAAYERIRALDDMASRFPGVTFKGPFVNIWGNPRIGEGTEIAGHVEIGDDVWIGKNCRIGAYAFICPGVQIDDQVFVGPHVTFTNDRNPPSKREDWQRTFVQDGAMLGANATILAGVIIGKGARIGAGAVVTKDVPAGETWAGVPARKLE